MRGIMLIMAGLLCSSPVMAQSGPPGGGPPGGRGRGGPPGMGEGMRLPRPMKPISRERFDRVVTAMFRSADTNRDGLVTIGEMRAILDVRRDVLIRSRFGQIDRNRNGTLDLEEFGAWQRSLGSAALSEGAASGGDIAAPDRIEPRLDDDMDDHLLARLIEPLGVVMIANANTNYDGGVSIEELLAYQRARFDKADSDKDGQLTMSEARGPDEPGPRGPGYRLPPDRRPPNDAGDSAPGRTSPE